MEHPLCTLCDPPRRHPLSEPHKFKDTTPKKSAFEKPADENSAFVRAAAKKTFERVAADEGIDEVLNSALKKSMDPYIGTVKVRNEDKVPAERPCPVCAARREKWKAAAKRHRAKKEKKV